MRGRLNAAAIGVRVFSSASDATRSRRPTDGSLLVLAILGALVLSFYAPGPTAIDTAATDLVAQLPDLAGWFWEVTYDLLDRLVLVLLLVILFAQGRKRLFLYEVLAVGVRDGVRDPRRQRQRHRRVHEPVGHHQLRVAADLPGDARRDRDRRDRDGVAGPVEADAADRPVADRDRRDRRGSHSAPRFPIGVAAGFLIGLGSAALVHLLFGSPGRTAHPRPGDGGARGARRRGHGDRGRPAAAAGRRAHPRVHARGKPLLVKTFGRDAADGQLVAATWYAIWRRGAKRGPDRAARAGRARGVPHAGRRAGRRARDAGRSRPARPTRAMPSSCSMRTGAPSARSTPDDVTVDLLRGCWQRAREPPRARHLARAGQRQSLVVRPDGSAALTDFGAAQVAAPDGDAEHRPRAAARDDRARRRYRSCRRRRDRRPRRRRPRRGAAVPAAGGVRARHAQGAARSAPRPQGAARVDRRAHAAPRSRRSSRCSASPGIRSSSWP